MSVWEEVDQAMCRTEPTNPTTVPVRSDIQGDYYYYYYYCSRRCPKRVISLYKSCFRTQGKLYDDDDDDVNVTV